VSDVLGKLRDIAQRAGFDVIPMHRRSHPLARRMSLLAHHRIDVVLDVGANGGQYGRELRRLGYRGRIVSFEPLAEPYARLEAERRGDSLWESERVAVGPTPGEATLRVAANEGASSSFLPMLQRHREVAPQAGYVGEERVRVERLDALLARHVRPGERTFVKIDTQGFERAVVESAGDAVARVTGFQLELSLVRLYEGGALFHELEQMLRERGFLLMSVEPGISDPKSGQLLQMDGVFFRDGGGA
jgi:FkbM family methyltransferase